MITINKNPNEVVPNIRESYLVGLERTKREDSTVHGGDESGVLPLCYKSIYTMTA